MAKLGVIVEASIGSNVITKSLLSADQQNCRFRDACLGLAQFTDAVVDGGGWSRAYLERSNWSRAKVRRVVFSDAIAVDSRIEDATFEDCDFRGANLGRKDHFLNLGRCRNTHFRRCDFRRATFEGLRLDGTVFDHCHFHGLVGCPVVEASITVINPDLSPSGDDTDIRPADDIVRKWAQRSG
jgi:uncharacterized protein YjbI with pentapeptide repeats